MPTAEEILGITRKQKAEELLGLSTSQQEPISFDMDKHTNDFISKQPSENGGDLVEGTTSSLFPIVRPFLSQGYKAAAALNRGLGVFSEHLNAIDQWGRERLGLKSSIPWRQIAENYDSYSDYWSKRAEEVGVNFIDELIGEAVGGAIPGIGEFILNVPYAATLGAAEAYKKGENEIAGALVEGAKRGVLGMIFKIIDPLKQYLRAPIMGTVFGVQSAAEGGEPKEIAKGIGTGILYSLTSPGGQMGLNEIRGKLDRQVKGLADIEAIKAEAEAKPELGKEIKKETPWEFEGRDLVKEFIGEKEGEQRIETRPRKFVQTVEESLTTHPRGKEILEEIRKEEPQEYYIQPNRESLEKANKKIETDLDESIKYVLSDKPMDAEKGATFISLTERFQREGDYSRAIEMVENYDMQLREAGRFVQAASIWNRLTPQGFVKWAEKEIVKAGSKYGWVDTLFGRKKPSLSQEEKIDILKRKIEINKMPDGPEKSNANLELIDKIALKVPPSVSEIIDAYRYQNMLSGPRTQMRNIGENILNTFITRPWDIATRGSIDFVQSGLFGKERQAYLKDVPIYLRNTVNAVPNAINAFVQSWKMESPTMAKPEIGIEYKTQFEQARAKQMPGALTIVQRFMEASDKFNVALISSGEYAVQRNRGATDIEALARSREIAERFLYRNRLKIDDPNLSIPSKILAGMVKMVEQGRKLPGIGKPIAWAVPFIRTPMNKGIMMIELSPLGLARTNWNQEIAGRIMGGSIVTGLGAMTAYLGETTWSSPSDPKEKEWFYATGRKPFSVKIGESWVPLWYLGPFALAFGIPAAIKNYQEQEKRSLTNDQFEKLFNIAAGLVRFLGSQTSVQSIGNLFSYLSGDINFTGLQQFAFSLGQMIPAQSMIRWINQAIDPVYRKPEGFIESVKKDLPILSKELAERKTPFGLTSERDLINFFLPYDIGFEKSEYDALYPLIRYQDRLEYIQNRTKSIFDKFSNGEVKPDKAMKEFDALNEAYLKVLQEGISK